MSLLLNFEDTYGIADIACKELLGYTLDDDMLYLQDKDIIVRKGLNTSVFSRSSTILSIISSVVFVYDMDKGSPKDVYTILTPERLSILIDKAKIVYNNLSLFFMPVSFCAETICLYLLNGGNTLSYETEFSKINTAHLHTKLLTDDLISIHPYEKGTEYWWVHGGGKHTLKVKNTRLFLNDFVYDYSQFLDSKYVKHLFKWLESGDITDTSKFLTEHDALILQQDYYNEFKKFISTSHTSFVYNKNTYRRDVNYK